MSVIRAQAFRFSIVNYLATALAAISTLWIYPLELDAYGLAQLLVSIAMLCIPLSTMGTLALVVKFFPEYKKRGLQKAYLFNILVLGFGSLALAGVIAVLVNKPILKFLEFLSFDAYLIAKHKYALGAMIAIMLYNSIMIMHASNYNKIAIPSAYQNLWPKVVLPVLILAVYSNWINMARFAQMWVLSFGVASIGLTYYLSRIGALDVKPEFHFFKPRKLRQLLSYSSYVGAGTMGNILIGKIDVIMVGTLIGLKETGVYGMALFIANVLTIPATGIFQISAPVLSEAFEHNNMDRVTEVYKKSSTNLLVIGIFMYFMLLGTLDAILHLSPRYEEIAGALPLFAIIGLSKLIDMGAGMNQPILTYSSKYKSIVVFVATMAICNIILNFFLIKKMGVMGAALATCFTMYLSQLMKYLYIEKALGIHPFSNMTPRLLILFSLMFLYYLILPQLFTPILQAIVYALGALAVFLGGHRILGIQSDATDMIMSYYRRGRVWLGLPPRDRS